MLRLFSHAKCEAWRMTIERTPHFSGSLCPPPPLTSPVPICTHTLTLERKRVTASFTGRGFSIDERCPAPGMTTSSAPEMLFAMRRDFQGGNGLSSSPTTTRVGALIWLRRPTRSSRLVTASIPEQIDLTRTFRKR